mmetsp:Transcript_11465/g.28513  ORF Transcript_11465/g.28513 Transcript_11465/m.28513 type:complete len:270 (-) Transcript_11465:113-922(-)
MEHQGVSLYGVFDGHGPNGQDASCRLSEYLVPRLQKSLENHYAGTGSRNVLDVVSKEFLSADANMVSEEAFQMSGSTGTIICLMGQKVLCAWLGDSRAVMGSESKTGGIVATHLSNDHKPNRPDEKLRVEKAGGEVRQAGFMDSFAGPMRVFKPGEQFPGLAISRSFGDAGGKSVGVTAVPEMSVLHLTREVRCIIICSDGVWDEMSAEECVRMVMTFSAEMDADGAAQTLCNEARRRWVNARRDGFGNIDDITAVVAMLRPKEGFVAG